MDPLSVAVSVISLGSAIGNAVIAVTGFVTDVRDAKADLDKVSRELASLQGSIEALKSLNQNPAIKALDIPQALKRNLHTVLGNCMRDVRAIERLLRRLRSAGALGRIEWTTSGRTDVNRLRSSLESHKMSLGISVGMINLTSTGEVKLDTSEIKTIVSETTVSIGEVQEEISSIAHSTNRVEQNTGQLLFTTNRNHDELVEMVRDLQRQMQELRINLPAENASNIEELRTLELAQQVTEAALRNDGNSSVSAFTHAVDEDEDENLAREFQREEYSHEIPGDESTTPSEIVSPHPPDSRAPPSEPSQQPEPSLPAQSAISDLDFATALRLQSEECEQYYGWRDRITANILMRLPAPTQSTPQHPFVSNVTNDTLCPLPSQNDRNFREVLMHKNSPLLYHTCRPLILEKMIKDGADVNIYLINFRRPLHIAVMESYLPFLHLLLAYGALPNLADGPTRQSDSPRVTPLHLACGKAPLSFEMARLLISYGAKVNIKDRYQRTPLHEACASGQLKTVRHLLWNGADVNSVDGTASTPLHLAIGARKFQVAIGLLRWQGIHPVDVTLRNHAGEDAEGMVRKVGRGVLAADGVAVEELLETIGGVRSARR